MPPPILLQIPTGAFDPWSPEEIEAAIFRMITVAVVAFLVHRFVRRLPWPRPFRFRFALVNLAAALATGVLWLGLSMALESLLVDNPLERRAAGRWTEFLFLGFFLYAVVAGITYAVEATARAARAEAAAARTQLAA